MVNLQVELLGWAPWVTPVDLSGVSVFSRLFRTIQNLVHKGFLCPEAVGLRKENSKAGKTAKFQNDPDQLPRALSSKPLNPGG